MMADNLYEDPYSELSELNMDPNPERTPLISNLFISNTLASLENTPYKCHSETSNTTVTCTYCIHSPVPALKSCLLCEASLCVHHLQVHSKSPEHVLTVPLSNVEKLRVTNCSIHKEAMKYYCFEDSACICVSCCFAGQHKGHQVELLEKASEKRKEDLRNLLEKLISKQRRLEMRVLMLEQQRSEVQDRSEMVMEKVAASFQELRRQLDDLERRLLGELLAEEDRISKPFTLLINQLQSQQEELASSIIQIQDFINLSDPWAILTKTSKMESLEPEGKENVIYDLEDIDEGLISVMLNRSFNEIMETFKMAQGFSDLVLDIKTAANDVYISGDKKTISWSKINQRREKQTTRFKSLQVLSTSYFSSGQHYWEVQTSGSGEWMIGVCYPSMERKGIQSILGNNSKSWCLSWKDKELSVRHDKKVKHFLNLFPCCRVGIYLDYEGGRLSFYKLDDPIRHLHTFMETFREPLLPAFMVQRCWLRIKT